MPFASVRAVILGQDPYHRPGQAHGLAFSVPDSCAPLLPSLRNIRAELPSDVGLPSPPSGSLVPWARHGVLLLNTALTVREGTPGSHAEASGVPSSTVLAVIAAKPDPVALAPGWTRPTCSHSILGQVAGIELDDATIGAVVAALGGAPRPVGLAHARIDRKIRELALEHAAGRLEDAAHLERLRELREAKDTVERTRGERVAAERAIEWLRALSATWTEADVPVAKADVLHAIYDQIVVTGREIVSVRLTSSAYAHGLALALPTKVALARPTGVGRADATNIRIPIEGAGEPLTSRESA